MSQVLAELGENGKRWWPEFSVTDSENCFDARWGKWYEQIEAERSVDGWNRPARL